MRKIQQYLYYLLFLITPFVMYSATSELFEFNKMIFIYIIISGILCIWFMRMMQKGKIVVKKTPFDIFIWLFFLSQVISTIFSIDVHTSLFGLVDCLTNQSRLVSVFTMEWVELSGPPTGVEMAVSKIGEVATPLPRLPEKLKSLIWLYPDRAPVFQAVALYWK